MFLIKSTLPLTQPHFNKFLLFVLPRLQVLVCCSQRVLHVFVLSQRASVLQPGPAVVLVLVRQSQRRLRVPQLGQPVEHFFGFASYLVAQLLHKTVDEPQMLGCQPGFLLGFSESSGEVILAWIHVTWGWSRRQDVCVILYTCRKGDKSNVVELAQTFGWSPVVFSVRGL